MRPDMADIRRRVARMTAVAGERIAVPDLCRTRGAAVIELEAAAPAPPVPAVRRGRAGVA